MLNIYILSTNKEMDCPKYRRNKAHRDIIATCYKDSSSIESKENLVSVKV
ncbi:MAG: hypothetical protein P857_654 [Candidatus Xenolissoclinum pacificiensis L6]|uniref:Uncharacterized protein n=1 Tax=Candidatus Xenolissoclinum pacificiensis L6 TaxID=1401685 RepID=W2UYG9_9RICK|nr:MAG: hypothetical protein P857_654 [Candidatus Xenolissoclinum pacificiensis L6]